ncbi:hypothetical protein BDV93DRAFT_565304 [Ceratobasidium sp. AG-I]|nr:hypothetical protein BDV93DRAFT_565304 [Ceratobasidium sp. AG-I]
MLLDQHTAAFSEKLSAASCVVMFASRSAESVSQARPVRVKSMSILAKLLTPKPKMQLDGPQTAYIRRKAL